MFKTVKKFLKNTKGAVTVFVTLALVPAMLISGTAVDLARIYTAQSILQDANQLAANSVLTQYNALLHDLYGIFGIAKNDPVLAQLLDDYISVTVFGEPGQSAGPGNMELFYGSNLSYSGADFADGKNLRNPDVLQRQIEEYMKFRAPVIIVKELLEMLGKNTFSEDTAVIGNKVSIDEDIAGMFNKYEQLYKAILAADVCNTFGKGYITSALGIVSGSLENILGEFHDLKACMNEWEEAVEEDKTEKRDDLAAKYKAILGNIKIRVTGGTTGKNWTNGAWKGSGNTQGLYKSIESALSTADKDKPKFDDVADIAKEIDTMRDKLSKKVDELEEQINSGRCSDELAQALTETDPATGKSAIEMYRELLKWDNVEEMAQIYKDGGYEYIDVTVGDIIRGVIYRNKYNSSDPVMTPQQLEGASTRADLMLTKGNPIVSALAYGGDKPTTYQVPGGLVKFGEYPGDNEIFFKELEEMMSYKDLPPVSLYDEQEEAEGKNAKEKQNNLIDNLKNLADSAFAGMTNSPLGAKYIDIQTDDEETVEETGVSGLAAGIVNHPVTDVITDLGGMLARAGDYILLLTYCSSMFSGYTTGRPEINGKKPDETDETDFSGSLTGVPVSPEVNYFFQSELEYLYNGSTDAGKNLSAISRLIFLVRMICNYITVFNVSDITSVVNTIRTTFAWSPPLGFLLGELARAAFVAAESAVDTATLRAGYKVPLIKKASDWICSPKGLVKALKETAIDAADNDEIDKGEGLSYSNYLLLLFVAKRLINPNAATEMALRASDLIEWNVINYKSGINCDEEKMAEAMSRQDRFRLEDMKTHFTITTSADMRMLFLSMLFAQNFADSRGIRMAQSMPVTVTDYAGY